MLTANTYANEELEYYYQVSELERFFDNHRKQGKPQAKLPVIRKVVKVKQNKKGQQILL